MSVLADEAAGPDWRRVPFEVGCARCGADLRGLQEPRCPSCGLTFEWSDAVPVEELICESCGYHLYGLEETRCPECGKGFTWDGALAARLRRKTPLFEYHWRGRPVRSFLTSLNCAMRPSTHWRRVDLHDRPPVQALAWLAAVVVVLFTLVLSVHAVLMVFLWQPLPTRNFAWPNLGWADRVSVMAALVMQEAWSWVAPWVATIGVWCVSGLGSLMIFRQSMRIYKVRTGHVVRVWCYSVVMPVSLLSVGMLIWVEAWCAANRWGGRWWVGRAASSELLMMGLVVLMSTCAGFAIASLRHAYESYLGMDRAIWVGVASQVVAGLATATVMLPFALG